MWKISRNCIICGARSCEVFEGDILSVDKRIGNVESEPDINFSVPNSKIDILTYVPRC